MDNLSTFLDAYENKAKGTADASVDIASGDISVTPKDDLANKAMAGESDFDPEKGIVQQEEKPFKIDTGALLMSLDYGRDAPTDDERYCAISFLEGRVGVDEIDDNVAPHMVAAISHTLFRNKNDFDGTIMSNTLKFYDKARNKYAEGYDENTKKWDSKTLLKHVKTAWDIIRDDTGVKRRAVLEGDLRDLGFSDGSRDFFSDERSQAQLDFMYDIASKRVGAFERFKSFDNADSARMVSGNGFDLGLGGWFGVKSIPTALAQEGSRTIKTAWGVATAESNAELADVLRENTTWHYALESKGLGNEFDESDKYILDMLSEHYGTKRGDYKALFDKVNAEENGIVSLQKDGEVQAYIAVPKGLARTDLKTSLLVNSGNEVYRKVNVIQKFRNDFTDTLGVTRLADAIGMLGSDPKAAEGVAIYTAGRKDNGDILGFITDSDGNADGLRTWANEYLAEANSQEDERERFNTVQTAFATVQNLMSQPSGVLPEHRSWWSEWGAGGANIGINFASNVWGFLSGTGSQLAYKTERMLDGIRGETEENARKAHREHMISQQVRNIAAWDVHNEGSWAGWLGEQVVGFKAFELVFAARMSSVLNRMPSKWAQSAGKWLTKSRGAQAGRIASKADEMAKVADDIEAAANDLMRGRTAAPLGDNLRAASDSLTMIEKAEALSEASKRGVEKMNALIGNARSAEILDYWRTLLDRTPGLFMIHESTVDDMERATASRYADIMVGNDTGYDDKMWSDAQDIIQGRAVVSTGFMANLGEFFKKIKSSATIGGAADSGVAKAIIKLETDFINACKAGDANAISAHILGLRIAFGEGVLNEARHMAKLGFAMGSTNVLGENIQDAAVGVKPWIQVGDGVVQHGIEEGGAMGVTLAFMRSLKGGMRAIDVTSRNLTMYKTMAQTQRPENIISSILARGKALSPDAKEPTRDKGIAKFTERLGDYFDRMTEADEAKRDASIAEWRKENRQICGEEGAKMFDAFVRDLKYAPQVLDWRLENLGQRITAKDLMTTLKAGGLDAKTEQLDNGDVVVDVKFDYGGSKIGSKLLVHGGTIYVQEGEAYKPSFAKDVVKNISEGKASKELIDRYNALTPEMKKELEEKGVDADGILSDATKEMQGRGLFFTKEEAVEGKKTGERNLVNIESPELYDGIVFLANGSDGARASIKDTRHEIVGHAVLDALKKAGAVTDKDIADLKEQFGGDAKWEERYVDAVTKAMSAGDSEIVKELLPEQRTIFTKVRDAARGLLKAMNIVKESRGPESTFKVDAFVNETIDRARETVKLRAERERMEAIVKSNREAAEAEARAEAAARRRELEQSIAEETARNKELGQERAVRIAKSRDEMQSVEDTIAKLADKSASLDDFMAKVEKSKGEFIRKMKRLGFDKGEVGKMIEGWFLGRVDANGNRLIERLAVEKEAADRKAEADALEKQNKLWRENARKQWEKTERKLAEDAAKRAKDEYKAKLEAERERIQAKAESKKKGEELAKGIAVSVRAAEELGYEIYKNLLQLTSVKAFDAKNKSILRAFDRATSSVRGEVRKPHRDALKREMYEARKKMELKADAIKAKKAEEEAALTKQKEAEKKAREKQRAAEAKAKAKKAEQKAKAEAEKKALAQTVKEASAKVERLLKSKIAEQKQAQKNAGLIVKGFELMDKGQPVPNNCVIAGLKGDQLTKKRASMRKAGYYYDKETDSWVNKKSTPKQFKKAAAKEVGKTIDNIVNAKIVASLKGNPEKLGEYYLGILNGLQGNVGEISEGSDTSKTPVKEEKKESKKTEKPKKAEKKEVEKPAAQEAPLTEEQRQNVEAYKVISAMIRQNGVALGWSKEMIEQKLREVSQLNLSIDPTTNQISVKGKAEKPAEAPVEEAPKAEVVPETPDNKTLREEKKWWTKQLTAEERLGLGVVEVLGKPWGVVYCAGEIIQGGETVKMRSGDELPQGAVIRPFSVAAVEKALDAMADRRRKGGGVIEAEMRTKPFFNADWAITEKKIRTEKREANAKAKADAERAEAERAALDEINRLQNRIISLKRESHEIEHSVVEEKRTIEDLQKLNPKELIALKPEYTKEEAASKMADIAKEIAEVEAKLADKTKLTHEDGVEKGKEIAAKNSGIGGIFTGSTFDYAILSRLGGVDDGPSLLKIGTGEGTQVYGWGLYGSNQRGVAEDYANRGKYYKLKVDGKDFDQSGGSITAARALHEAGMDYDKAISKLKEQLAVKRRRGRSVESISMSDAIELLEDNRGRLSVEPPSKSHVYEQTFFTNRTSGDESHLLNWYEPISKENLKRVNDQLKGEHDNPIEGDNHTGESVYKQLSDRLGGPEKASRLLVAADIDGIKYPVDSYGKDVKDGDKVGWDYVSFRDDNIRVDKKWTDGELQYGVDVGKEIATEAEKSGGRFSIGGIYTGSAFNYASNSRLGGVGDGPSLVKIGTGEGAQAYGWGLYGTNRKGIAKHYAEYGKNKETHLAFDDKEWDKDAGDLGLNAIMLSYMGSRNYLDSRVDLTDFAKAIKEHSRVFRTTANDIKKRGKKHPEYSLLEKYLDAASKTKEAAKDPTKTLERIKEVLPSEHIYEQTFFTNREKGDESHLINWYEPISQENYRRIVEQLAKEGYKALINGTPTKITRDNIKSLLKAEQIAIQAPDSEYEWLYAQALSPKWEGGRIYKSLPMEPKETSEFLVRADIDGVKYPAKSYGRAPQDGDKVGWNYVSFRDDNIRVDKKWKDGELQYGSDGKMMVAFRQGVERLFMGEFDVIQDKAKELVDEMMETFITGPAYKATQSILEDETIDKRSAIPNWMVNERIELSHDASGYAVTLPSGFKFFLRKGGFGGDNLAKMKRAVEEKDINGLHAEVQVEFADGKAKLPYGFKQNIEADEARVLADKKAVEGKNNALKAKLKDGGISDTMVKKLEKAGAFGESTAKFETYYTVADFFPDSKTLAEIYPDTYQNTQVIIRGSERAKALVDEKGKQIPEPMFAKGQFASLDTQGNIIVDMSSKDKRIRVGDDIWDSALLRDITACVVKKIRREEGIDDDVASSAQYLTDMLGVKGRDKKTGASTKFKLYEDKTLKDILTQAIKRRFAKREAIGLKATEEEIKRATDACEKELSKVIYDCFTDFVSEREAVMFANRFGLSNEQLSQSFGEAQRKAHENAIISPFDKNFTTRQKSDSYAQYYRQVLRKIDGLVSVGAEDHKSRSLVNEFDALLDEFLRYEYRENARSRGGKIYSVSPELRIILGIDGSGMKAETTTALQSKGEDKGYEKVVVDTSTQANTIENVMKREEDAIEAAQPKPTKVQEVPDASGITPKQRKAMDKLDADISSAFIRYASGKSSKADAAKVIQLMGKLGEFVREINPKASEEKVNGIIEEARRYFAFKASKSPLTREKDGKREVTPLGAILTDGRMSVQGVDFEQSLVASYSARIAWEKSKHRGANTADIADALAKDVVADLRSMGIPEADAKSVSMSIVADAKVVADSIVAGIDSTVTEAQIIAQAKTKAARQRIGNSIYRSFKRGYKVGNDGVEAHDRAERIVERQRMRAMRRAVGYTMAELNSELGIDLIGDLVNIGRDGFKYGTAEELSRDLTRRAVASFRADNVEMKNATDGEIMADPVFRAEYAATVSSWLVEAAKSLSYGQERELAIRDAMRIRVTMPPTLRDLERTVEHHAEMLGKNLGRMDVEATLKEIDKLIDSRPKIDAEGNIKAGAMGGTRTSERDSVYRRGIEPRLQEYWKYVKKVMRFDGDKVREEIERLSTTLETSETELARIKETAPSGLKAESLESRDDAVMKLSALMRYGALIERSAGEVMDVYRNDIARDIAYAAKRFLVELKRRNDENAEVANDFINDISELLKGGRGFEDISKARRAVRSYFMWNVPDLFTKLRSHFKTDSRSFERVGELAQNISLAHEEQMRLTSNRQGELIKAIEDVYGMPFADFIQTACVPDPKYRRFSRSGWMIPESGGPTVEYWTGKYYQNDMPKLGKKKGDRIYETLKLAVPIGNALHTDKTKADTELSLANLIYIYAACRQRDMEKNSIIYGRDAAYMKDLENTIGTKGVMVADRIVKMYDDMRQDISPVSEYITGMPVLSPDRFYVPLRFVQDKEADRVTRYTVNPVPKFLTNRRFHDGATLKEDTNVFELTMRRIQDAYHYKAFGVLADNVKQQLASKKVVTMFHKLLGDNVASDMFDQLNETFNGGTAIDHQGGVGIRNFITATALGFSPSSSLKQLEGIGGWGLGMKPTEWVKMVLWDKWFNQDARRGVEILHQSGFFEKKRNMFGGETYQRAEGFSEPMLLLMNARENGGTAKAMSAYTKAKEWYKGHMLDFMRFFDRVSTDFGAGTYYASRLNFYKMSKGMTEADAHRAALADTDYMIQVGQASGRPEFMHSWQRRGTTGKFLTHFVGPTLVRAGVELEALHRHFMVDRSRKSFNTLASKLFAAHVVCPAILTGVTQLANYFFGERDNKNAGLWDDFAENLAVSMLLGPLSGMLIIGQIADGSLRKIANRGSTSHGWRRRYEIPLTSKLNALADSLVNIGNDTASIVEDLLEGAEITPNMVNNVRLDVMTLLKQVFPMMRLVNFGENIYQDVLSDDKPRRWASPE